MRDTRVLLRNVHYPSESPSERAKLEQELEGVDIARCFIDLVISLLSLAGAAVIMSSCPM